MSKHIEYNGWAMLKISGFAQFLFTCFVLWSQVAVAQNTNWLLGGELTRVATEVPVSVDWQGAPLRERLKTLAERQKVAVFLDRRVDGSQALNFSANNVTMEEMLWRMADQLDLGICRVGDVYYFGPKETAASLPQEIATIQRGLSELKRNDRFLSQSSVLQFPRLSQPRQIIQSVCQNNGLQLTRPELIPHDLWAETSLPPLKASTQLSLLLVGFEKSYSLSEDLSQIAIVPLETPESIELEIQTGKAAAATFRELKKQFPDAQLRKRKRSIIVTGDTKTVLQVQRAATAAQKPVIKEGAVEVFSIETVSARISILASLAKQMDRKLVYDREDLPALKQRVEISMQNATADQLIIKTLEESGFRHRVTETELIIER